MEIKLHNIQTFTLPPSLGGNPVEVKLHLGLIVELSFFDDEYNPLIIVSAENFYLLNINTIVYIKSKVYATN